ncbi:MAG: TonB-dependent receptor [Gammaproteobacteria bacterium]|nr:TonB-dependent receptor [Gammaproteobacteria bacterium]
MKKTHKRLILISGISLLTSVTFAERNNRLEEVTVTATREAQSIKESSHSVGVISEETIEQVKPGHPSEVMGRVPGVHVNVTGGEGHMTAIRQPLSTSPLYLYLEDGIPTRSTGFFNHNALYEINVPQASRLEVSKGPGSALYGSDAIGAVVNAQTNPAPLQPEAMLDLETGGHGFRRFLFTGGNTTGDDGYRADLNLTHTDGWRKSTEYDRQSVTGRWDRTLQSGATLKTVITHSNIDQQTAGSSRLYREDFENNPTENYTPISYRKVEASRLSMAYEKETADSLINITPYLRSNTMELLPNWSLGYDPTVYETGHGSLGLQAKYRMDFSPMKTRLISGIDIDHSPGSREEKSIRTTKAGKVYTSYTEAETVYDYDVTFTSVSPYAHLELSPSSNWRVTAGLRYDHMEYDYDNKLSGGDIELFPFATQPTRKVTYRQLADTTVSYHNLSTKLGTSLQLSANDALYLAYREAFRAPSEGQIFRPGSSTNTTNLKPVKIANREIGLRGRHASWNYDLSVYSMVKRDDIITFEHANGPRETVNAGKTLHEGVELGIGVDISEQLSFDIAASYAEHRYENWVQKSTSKDYSGKEMPAAPRQIMSARLGYKPDFMNDGLVELEWDKLGRYWMDNDNTTQYEGHNLYNLRLNYPISKKLELYGRLMNLGDKRYATNAAVSSGQAQYAPGIPRTYYIGLSYQMF